MTLHERLQHKIKLIEEEINLLNQIIQREERNEICASAKYHRGERYALRNIKHELLELIE